MHLVILVWPTRVRMEARHKAATAIELPKEGRTVPSELCLGLIVAPRVGRRWTILGWNSRLEQGYETPETEKALQEGHPHGSRFC